MLHASTLFTLASGCFLYMTIPKSMGAYMAMGTDLVVLETCREGILSFL